ncbi:hypothetical protein [Burkholderia plantarii]|uniref:hypothetical protein n=1 Tax=Burkholderia plantarii TaxID=41899 RepID=UPI001F5B28E0|nr:hypothetical protein [Burkholderia plantarii]
MSHCSDDTIQLADGKHAAARERVAAGLDGDSTLDSGRPANTPLDLTIVAPATGEPPGGLSGHTSLGASFIEMFNLPRTLRRPGVGSDLLLRAEAGARRPDGAAAIARCATRSGSRRRAFTESTATACSAKCRASRLAPSATS